MSPSPIEPPHSPDPLSPAPAAPSPEASAPESGDAILDTHAHLDGPEFADDLPDVIARARAAGVQRILIPAVSWSAFPHLLATCRRFPGYLFPMLGLHPEEVDPAKLDIEGTLTAMEAWLADHHQQIVAIGEVGLDLYWDATYRSEQLAAFRRQVEWAQRYGLPLMIHCRKAQQDLVASLRQAGSAGLRGCFHCFTGSAEQARELLSFSGFCLGIGGALTFKKAKLPQVLAQCVPLSRIVLETDAPYLTPVPHRGERNESAHLVHVVEKLSEVYNLPAEEIRRQTALNARRLFFPQEKS